MSTEEGVGGSTETDTVVVRGLGGPGAGTLGPECCLPFCVVFFLPSLYFGGCGVNVIKNGFSYKRACKLLSEALLRLPPNLFNCPALSPETTAVVLVPKSHLLSFISTSFWGIMGGFHVSQNQHLVEAQGAVA